MFSLSLSLSQCHCAVLPLYGDEPLSVVDSFRRVFQLLSAGLFLPGSIGLPDPCEVYILYILTHQQTHYDL